MSSRPDGPEDRAREAADCEFARVHDSAQIRLAITVDGADLLVPSECVRLHPHDVLETVNDPQRDGAADEVKVILEVAYSDRGDVLTAFWARMHRARITVIAEHGAVALVSPSVIDWRKRADGSGVYKILGVVRAYSA